MCESAKKAETTEKAGNKVLMLLFPAFSVVSAFFAGLDATKVIPV
jgi:hypothetical protein